SRRLALVTQLALVLGLFVLCIVGMQHFFARMEAERPHGWLDMDFATQVNAATGYRDAIVSADGYPILKDAGPLAQQAGLRNGDEIIAIGKMRVSGLKYSDLWLALY